MGVPTVRDLDGLALSSRNARLDRAARQQAAAIPAALRQVGAALSQGASVQAAADEGHALLHNAGIVDVDYLVVTGEDLGPVPTVGPARALVAATVGGVHLIDNIAVEI
jgi:pantoate--beta-alanine ligase